VSLGWKAKVGSVRENQAPPVRSTTKSERLQAPWT